MTTELLLFLGTFALGLLTCRLALRLVRRLQLIDLPNERSSHDLPTPRGGGLGILAATLCGSTVGAILLGAGAGEAISLAFAALVLAWLGFLDDRKGAGPFLKMALQLVAAGAVLWGVGWVESVRLPGLGEVALGWAAIPLTLFWLVGFSNAYNFMDGIDGIAGQFASLSALAIFMATAVAGGGGVAWVAIPLSAASLSFLSVNRSPAKVFMGDVGSLPVGFLLAACAVLAWKSGGVPFVASFLALGPFLFDTMFTLVRRVVRGENVLRAHKSHLYQRLVVTGIPHGRVTFLYGAWTLFTGGLGLLYLSGRSDVRAAALAAALLSGFVMVVAVAVRERKSS